MALVIILLLLIAFCGKPLPCSLPFVPDPKFPALPQEFLSQVDESCQNIIYVGGSIVANKSDYFLITAVFRGCKPVSQGYCEGKLRGRENNTMLVYKRSWTGYWVALGFKQEYYPVCTQPDPSILPLQKLLETTLISSMSSTSSSLNSNISPKAFADNKAEPLPRIADMPLPTEWPPLLINCYKEVCRYYKGHWNVNFEKQTEQQFYQNCNFTGDSGKYCKEPLHEYPNLGSEQNLKLRSQSGGFAVVGYKARLDLNCPLE